MVWNVTKDSIRVCMAEVDHHTWAPPLAAPAKPLSLDDRKAFAKEYGLDQKKVGFSDFTSSGYWNVDDVLRPIYEEASKALGRDFPYPEEGKKQ